MLEVALFVPSVYSIAQSPKPPKVLRWLTAY